MISQQKHVLIVDDDQYVRDLLATFYQVSGYTCTVAANGNQAYNLILNQRPDLVVTDCHMPFMNGLQLLAKVKNIFPNLPVIFISGFPNLDPETLPGIEAADGRLEKPIALDQLDEMTRRLL